MEKNTEMEENSLTDEQKLISKFPLVSSWFQALKKTKITLIEAILFSLLLPIGNQSTGWNVALQYGVWTNFASTLMSGIGYLCLCLCLSEMNSALPFSGGIFGCVRATAGPFSGYLVACFELFTNITYIASAFASVTSMPSDLEHLNVGQHVGIICSLYIFALICCLLGNRPFWIFTVIVGACTLILMLIYLFGAMKAADFAANALSPSTSPSFTFLGLLSTLEICSTQYMGIQYIPLLGKHLPDARKDLPIVMLTTMGISLIVALLICILTPSNYPGVDSLSGADYPLNYVFQKIFTLNSDVATWLNFPGLYGGLFVFIFCYGSQLHTISKMGLLPSSFQQTIPILETPYSALIIGVFICLGLNILLYYYPIVLTELVLISSLSTYIVFFGAFASYIIFKLSFGTLQRSFVNPFGIPSAILGMIIFLFCTCSAVYFDENSDYRPFVAVIVYFIATVIFYFTYMVHHQTFSAEEKQNLFQAYLLNANRAKRNKLKGNNKVAPNVAASKANTKKNTTNNNNGNNFQSKMISISNNQVVPLSEEKALNNNSEKEEQDEGEFKMNSANPAMSSFDLENQFKEEEVRSPQADNSSSHRQQEAIATSNLSIRSSRISGRNSTKSVLTEDQEKAVLALGGILEAEESL